MPSSERAASRRDRPERSNASRTKGKAPSEHAQGAPEAPQYFDPSEPWDPEAAEALTKLYESGEGFLHKREDEPAPPRRKAARRQPASQPARDATVESAWLEARLSEMSGLLQASLARLNPDKSIDQLNHRLDLLEERFNDVVGRVAQRSDLEGLKLIEAHIQELAAHVQEAGNRLDRIGAIDHQVQEVARRLDDIDHRRIGALEKLLQDYLAEWRRGDERTAAVLQNLEAAVGRVGDAVEGIEVYKPAPDLSLSILGEGSTAASAPGSDPISQVYAEAARVLEPGSYRPTLDAADYAPKTTSDDDSAPAPGDRGSDAADRDIAAAPAPPANPDGPLSDEQAQRKVAKPASAQEPADAARKAPRPARPRLLLTGAVTLFGALGYLLVDLFMAGHVASRPVQTESAIPAATAQSTPQPPTTEASEPPIAPKAATEAPASRIAGMGSALAAALRGRDHPTLPVVKTSTSISADSPPADQTDTSARSAPLPLAIGPASLRQAAMRGDAAAQTEIASRFGAGQGVSQDLKEALAWYSRAAAQGWAVAQYRLGAMYERGLGAPRDLERARAWYGRAAEQGNVRAMHNLAVLSVTAGRSDYVAAAKWFAQAAERGLTDSQVNLAILYQNGLGVSKDLAQAYRWLAIAARSGDAEAKARAARVKPQMNAADLARLDGEANTWRARPTDVSANET